MGTETHCSLSFHVNMSICSVKLNNPLMGTETSIELVMEQNTIYAAVKLNNPLMGTETQTQTASLSSHTIKR